LSPSAKWLLTILIFGLLHLMFQLLVIATMDPGTVVAVFPFGHRNQRGVAIITLVELCILAVVALAFVILLHRSGDD